MIEAELLRRKQNKIRTYFRDDGPYRRELYAKHLKFFRAGGTHEPMPGFCPEDCDGAYHRERLALAANRVGKTESIGGYEITLHLTGDYPDWWEGHRFDHPIDSWAAGDTSKTTRDIIQDKLLGVVGSWGTGLIPADRIEDTTSNRGLPDAVETIYVKHKSGGTSVCGLKSYDQGRRTFQGTAKHVVWLDEEPPLDVYTECLVRTMTVGGLVLLTFTPINGMSEVVLSFLPGGKLPGES